MFNSASMNGLKPKIYYLTFTKYLVDSSDIIDISLNIFSGFKPVQSTSFVNAIAIYYRRFVEFNVFII